MCWTLKMEQCFRSQEKSPILGKKMTKLLFQIEKKESKKLITRITRVDEPEALVHSEQTELTI